MPHEKDVQERKWWWCPKWYWPFAVCSGIRTQHKWCYNFAWVKETRYGVVSHLEGCENGKLYTWTNVGIGLGSQTYPGGELCFDSSLGDSEGRCDASSTGLLGSGLSASDPYISDIESHVAPVHAGVVAGSGIFEFTGENERRCQSGAWPWKRVLHEEVIRATVVSRFVTISWFIGGVAATGATGTVAVNAYCKWPFPLPNGRTENRIVHVRYEISTETDKSTLKLYNDPQDGSYVLNLGVSGMDAGKPAGSSYASVAFHGETCNFDAQQLAQLARCIINLHDIMVNEPVSAPVPGEKIYVVPDQVMLLVRDENRALVQALAGIIARSAQDRVLFRQMVDLFEQQLGLAGIPMLGSINASDQAHRPSPHLAHLAQGPDIAPVAAAALAGLAIGLLVSALLRAPGQRLPQD